jgi:hypothetical protein
LDGKDATCSTRKFGTNLPKPILNPFSKDGPAMPKGTVKYPIIQKKAGKIVNST